MGHTLYHQTEEVGQLHKLLTTTLLNVLNSVKGIQFTAKQIVNYFKKSTIK